MGEPRKIFDELMCFVVWLSMLITLYFCIDRMATAAERTHATCPGPLQAGDYYTPEE